jgi:hypothetical protein
MSVSQACAPDDPRLIAWGKYKASPEYANSFQWAAEETHRAGSMWAAFIAGFAAAQPPAQQQACEPVAQRYEADLNDVKGTGFNPPAPSPASAASSQRVLVDILQELIATGLDRPTYYRIMRGTWKYPVLKILDEYTDALDAAGRGT